MRYNSARFYPWQSLRSSGVIPPRSSVEQSPQMEVVSLRFPPSSIHLAAAHQEFQVGRRARWVGRRRLTSLLNMVMDGKSAAQRQAASSRSRCPSVLSFRGPPETPFNHTRTLTDECSCDGNNHPPSNQIVNTFFLIASGDFKWFPISLSSRL